MERMLRMLMYRFGFRYLQKGTDYLARPKDADGNPIPKSEMSAQERKRMKNTRQGTRSARQAARMAQRFRRF